MFENDKEIFQVLHERLEGLFVLRPRFVPQHFGRIETSEGIFVLILIGKARIPSR